MKLTAKCIFMYALLFNESFTVLVDIGLAEKMTYIVSESHGW